MTKFSTRELAEESNAANRLENSSLDVTIEAAKIMRRLITCQPAWPIAMFLCPLGGSLAIIFILSPYQSFILFFVIAILDTTSSPSIISDYSFFLFFFFIRSFSLTHRADAVVVILFFLSSRNSALTRSLALILF